jgi:hypothetical protein
MASFFIHHSINLFFFLFLFILGINNMSHTVKNTPQNKIIGNKSDIDKGSPQIPLIKLTRDIIKINHHISENTIPAQ